MTTVREQAIEAGARTSESTDFDYYPCDHGAYMQTCTKSRYKRHPDTVAALTQEEGILVCGAAGWRHHWVAFASRRVDVDGWAPPTPGDAEGWTYGVHCAGCNAKPDPGTRRAIIARDFKIEEAP